MTENTSESNPQLRISSSADFQATLTPELKARYGRGVYVQNIHEASTEEIVIEVGNSLPRDVSDCRRQDNTLKFVDVRNIATLHAEPTGNGYYQVMLPDRDEIQEGFKQRKKELVDALDAQMAQAIYSHVFELGPVKTQLTPILQILRWVRDKEPLDVERVDNQQPSDNTQDYITVLTQLGYIEVEEGEMRAGEGLLSADLNEISSKDFARTILGDVVKSGYHTLRDELGLNMLSHYPKFSSGYYYTAIQRNDPDVWLDIPAIQETLWQEYGEDHGELFVDAKLSELDEAGVVNKDGVYVQGVDDVYEDITPGFALA